MYYFLDNGILVIASGQACYPLTVDMKFLSLHIHQDMYNSTIMQIGIYI